MSAISAAGKKAADRAAALRTALSQASEAIAAAGYKPHTTFLAGRCIVDASEYPPDSVLLMRLVGIPKSLSRRAVSGSRSSTHRKSTTANRKSQPEEKS